MRIGQKLCDARDAVADYVLQQLARQAADPVTAIAQHRPCVGRIAEVVAIVALHVNWTVTQVSFRHQHAHAPGNVAELVVMSNRNLPSPAFSQLDELLCIACAHREGLLDVDVAPGFQAKACEVEMTLWRRGDVNDVGLGLLQHFRHVGKPMVDRKALV